MIDEAAQPTALPFEASSHLRACAPCKGFADERAALRGLLGAMPRVSAPAGFDTRLKARLAESRKPASFFRFPPAVFMRLGATAAVLVVAVFAAQYSGWLSSPVSDQTPGMANSFTGTPAGVTATTGGDTARHSQAAAPTDLTPPAAVSPAVVGSSSPAVRVRYVATRRSAPPVAKAAGNEEMYIPEVIVQGSGGMSSVPMLPVSVGAQQRMLTRSSRVTAQPVGVSF